MIGGDHIEVDGERAAGCPVGRHPALEFSNTWAGWNSPPGAGGDYLTSYDVLLTLVTHHGLLTEDAGRRGPGGRGRPGRARLGAPAGPPTPRRSLPPADRRCIARANTVVSPDGPRRPGPRSAGPSGDDGATRWRLEPRQPLRLPLLAVTAAAAQLLDRRSASGSVHACPGRDCGWLFLDPRNRRRWCSMAVCGNRAKARAHARRGHRA